MAAQKCLFIHGSAGAPTYAGADTRNMLAAIFGGSNFEAVSPGIGATARGHGVLTADAMAVTANGTPNNHVFVAPGMASVRGSQNNSQGAYICPLDASFDLTVSAAHATLDRKDLVVAQVKDAAFAAFTGDVWTPEIIVGTPAASPADPTVTEDSLVLARLLVRDSTEAGGTIVRPQDITDLRPSARATGGITDVATTASWPSPRKGDVIWDESTSSLKRYTGTVWKIIGLDFDVASTAYTPTLSGVTLGTGGVKFGWYYKMGKLVVGNMGFALGTGGDVTAEIGYSLPFAFADKATGHSSLASAGWLCVGNAADLSASSRWSGLGLLADDTGTARYFVTAGASARWDQNTPFDWASGDAFLSTFVYETA